MRMRRIVLSSVACLAVPYFSTLSHQRHDHWEKVTGYKMCLLIFSTNLSKIFIVLRRIERDIIINVCKSLFIIIICHGFGHLFTRPGLLYPEVSSKVCQLDNNVSLPWVILFLFS
jgi:hypothetical protein